MLRLEIIANNAVKADITECIENINKDVYYSRINSIHGKGHSNPKRGDAVWPEENFILIIYCDDETGAQYVAAMGELKKEFTSEGIKIFSVPCVELNETIPS